MIDHMCFNEPIICCQPQLNCSSLISRFLVSSFPLVIGFLLQQKEWCIWAKMAEAILTQCSNSRMSKAPFGINHGMDETPQGLIIGEYGNVTSRTWNFWKSMACLYLTQDDGESWCCFDYLVRTGAKHVHLVKYSRRFGRLLVTDGDKRKRSYWVGLIDQMKPREFEETRFDSFTRGGGHTGFAETENATLLGTDYRIAPNSLICVRSPEDSSARMLPRPYRHSPVMNMLCIKYRAGTITFAHLYNGLCPRCQNALIYSNDDGNSWCRLIEFDKHVEFSIANAQQGTNRSMVVSFRNTKLGEERTLILSTI